MSRFQMQIMTDHPVLFLSDPSSTSTPSDTAAAFVCVTADCLSFWVKPYVDGASLVTVSDEACEMGGQEVFNGTISAPSGVLTVTDSALFRYLNIPVPIGPTSVSVWADDDNIPGWVWIKLGTIRD